ncbi:MAG: ATP-grasp domain-containing protein [Verrucomicrobiota bacterium]
MKSLSVLLLDEQGHHSQKVALCLGQIPGLKVHVLSDERWVPVRFSRHITSFRFHAPNISEMQKLQTVLQTIEETASDVILPIVEGSSHFLHRCREFLAPRIALPPCAQSSTVSLVSSKDSLCHFLKQNRLPLPETIDLETSGELEKDLGRIKFPILFKPANGGEGQGIRTFVNRESFLDFMRTNPVAPRSIVQAYVEGHDVDCSVLCRDGSILAHTIQTSFRPRKNKFGSDDAIEFIEDRETLKVVEPLVRALNWSGVAHIDLRYDKEDRQIKVLDFNARYWTSLLGSLAAGVNFPYLACRAAMGESFDRPLARKGRFFTAGAAARNFFTNCATQRGVKLGPGESGLPYALKDPGPRIFTMLKKSVAFERRVVPVHFQKSWKLI